MELYTKDFYKILEDGARCSAKKIIPLVLELTQPGSVIDVGYGVGVWLSVFREYGIEDFLGIDGNYIDNEMLLIPAERFLPVDLKKSFAVERQFDLVVSLEVAEHLPAECAHTFVDSLVRLGPIVLFSAAIPFQGGTNHTNEQWQDYWAKFFREKGYVTIDCFRKKIWQDNDIEWWYAQNILLFVKQDYLECCPLLKRAFENTNSSQISIVHPKMYLQLVEKYTRMSEQKDISFRNAVSILLTKSRNWFKRNV